MALIAHYNLNNNSTDIVGGFNGTDTAVAYSSGKVGNAASFGVTSK